MGAAPRPAEADGRESLAGLETGTVTGPPLNLQQARIARALSPWIESDRVCLIRRAEPRLLAGPRLLPAVMHPGPRSLRVNRPRADPLPPALPDLIDRDLREPTPLGINRRPR